MSIQENLKKEKLVCSTIAFRHFSLETGLEAIESIGLQYVDIGTMPGFCPHFNFLNSIYEEEQQFIKTVSSSPLHLYTFTTHIGDFNAINASEQKFQQAANRNLQVAKQLGAHGINLNCGTYLDRTRHPFENDVKKVGRNIQKIAQKAETLDIKILIEAPHKGNLIRDAEEAMKLLEACDHDNVYLIFDCNHHHAAGWTMAEAVKKVGNHIGHVHLRDAVGRDNRYPLGAGEINFEELFDSLESIGYDGLFSFEFTDAGKTADDNKRILLQSIEFLSKFTNSK